MAKADADDTSKRSSIEAGFAFFVFLVSLREEIRARKVTRAKRARTSQRAGSLIQHQQKKPLPTYAERDRNGHVWFCIDGGKRVRLPKDPTTPEFHEAYNVALVDAIAREDDDGYTPPLGSDEPLGITGLSE